MASIGDSLAGRYRLDEVIGSGGFATVFRARDLRLERDVAVKVLFANHATDPAIAARFDGEARVLAAVSHPNVVAVHDVDPGSPETGEEPFLVMELCSGGSLADGLASSKTGAIHPDELIPMLVDVASGLGALHALGIVHRDLKPSNILLSGGRARIADLGIATTGPSDLTVVGTMIGTLAYLAPEQLAGEPGSPASDVYALGVIAFLGLTGRLPRPAGSVAEVVAASTQLVDPVSVLAPALGTAFDPVIARALAGDPALRPTAADLGATLAAARGRGPAGPVTTAGDEPTTLIDVPLAGRAATPPAPAPGPHRDRSVAGPIAAAVAGLGLLLVVLVLLGLGGGGGREAPSIAGSTASTSAPSTAPTPASKPTSKPTATFDAYARARDASVDLRAAIEGARGAGDLKGHEVKDLEEGLDRVDRALDQRDATAARDQANALAERIAKLIRGKSVGAQAGERLGTAAERLVAAASALPA